MGGCCCCSSKGQESSAPAGYYCYPRASEEHILLSSHQGAASVFAGELLVETSLGTSIPDTYRPPPDPIPFNVSSAQTPPVPQEICGNKTNASLHLTNSNSVQRTIAADNHRIIAKVEELKKSEDPAQTDLELDSAKDSEIELPKLAEPMILAGEEDLCAICLEEYDHENPKIPTKCDHPFHLACILEWMERSEACPVCDQHLVLDSSFD